MFVILKKKTRDNRHYLLRVYNTYLLLKRKKLIVIFFKNIESFKNFINTKMELTIDCYLFFYFLI